MSLINKHLHRAVFVRTKCNRVSQMLEPLTQLQTLANRCKDSQNSIRAGSAELEKTSTTKADYTRMATILLSRAKSNVQSIVETIRSTRRNSTYYKRLAALRYYLYCKSYELGEKTLNASNEVEWSKLVPQFQEHLIRLNALLMLQNEGFTSARQKRNSKRRALIGLPENWRTVLCNRGLTGKYGTALLVCALTGARPQELVRGIKIYHSVDRNQIYFEIEGVKVSPKQGQPNRKIIYDANDQNPLLQTLIKQIKISEDSMRHIRIDSANYFTLEVRRLAASIWPKHNQSVTAYCFRHQWSADIKSMGNFEDVSKGLGHISTKTQKYYGTTNQSNSADRLRPINIEADRPLREYSSKFQTSTNKNLAYAP